MPAVQIIQPVC